MRRLIFWTALAGFAYACSASAHHSIGMFDIGKPIWITGTVVRFEPVNPHVRFTLEQPGDDGRALQWRVEGPGLNSFNRRGLGDDFLQPGTVIEVCGFAFKAEAKPQSSAQNGSNRFLHGHVLRMPDGQMRLFGGYGKTENCIRPNDSIQQWVNFLERDRVAHQIWCDSRVSPNFPSVAPRAFVDEVNRLLSTSCGA
jgi:hypothetical protein